MKKKCYLAFVKFLTNVKKNMALNFCKINICKFYTFIVLGLSLLFLLPNTANAQETEEKKFDISSTIIDHVVDSYSWHIFTYKDHHVSINLPIILIDKEGVHVFSSARFHHGEATYLNYGICQEKNFKKGKIVKFNDDGTINKDFTYVDISITKNVLALFISIALLLWIFISVAKNYKKNGVAAPKGIARLLEPIILFVRNDVVRPSLKERSDKYMPYLLTLFFFIFINNLIGLIPIFPGGANLTGNIAITLVLAVLTFIITNVNGTKHYFADIVNTPGVPWWLKFPLPLMPLVEIVGVFTKPIVLMIRLFANITAGHIICLSFICLIFIFGATIPALGYGVSVVSVFFYIFMSVLELLVAFIQAFVFTLLSAIYIGMATENPHHEHEQIVEIK